VPGRRPDVIGRLGLLLYIGRMSDEPDTFVLRYSRIEVSLDSIQV
jgi:hypothetical protein